METLRAYLNSLPTVEQEAFARRCGTSIGYLRKAISYYRTKGRSINFDEKLRLALAFESGGKVHVNPQERKAA